LVHDYYVFNTSNLFSSGRRSLTKEERALVFTQKI